MKKGKKRMLIAAALVSALSLAFIFFYPHALSSVAASSSSQGCVNQGKDQRIAGAAICWAQRHLSWKSKHKPDFLLIGNSKGTSIGVAWPPYFVFNLPDGNGHWHMFRIGFRYDRNWGGYIFPTIALKVVSKPLRY